MKQLCQILILLTGVSALAQSKAKPPPMRVLENDIAKVTLAAYDRDEAEPVSKPQEVRVVVTCKKGYVQKKKNDFVTACSADVMAEKGISIDDKTIHFFHYEWDAAKTSADPRGDLHCKTSYQVKDQMALADFCQAMKK